ncbi:Laminin subunit alpha-2 [Hondaea fermentalgiana]|uniref:Laminin subunit alpha-2 n=1 Tax=Hondaea fermentalgiana TaxID=2315210 RepID=A0A2R5G990_9STRA|nr:Laminin subunit alpha-2 [Hondaea fermentalgiana]|eukprot:GBG24254.1 Laminin subunit alpha-2 [Hondaea fermentalgiana]
MSAIFGLQMEDDDEESTLELAKEVGLQDLLDAAAAASDRSEEDDDGGNTSEELERVIQDGDDEESEAQGPESSSLGSADANDLDEDHLDRYLAYNPDTPAKPKATPARDITESLRTRRALIEEGRKRMEEFRKRSATPARSTRHTSGSSIGSETSHSLHSRDLSPELLSPEPSPSAARRHPAATAAAQAARANPPTQPVPFTPVAQGFKSQLDKLKRDELDLAAAEWSEQRNRVSDMRREYEEELADMQKVVDDAREETQQAQQRNLKLEKDAEQSRKELASLKQQLEQFAATQRADETAAEELRTRIATQQKEMSSLRERVQAQAAELELRARETVSRLASNESEHEADMCALNDQLEEQIKSIRDLEEERDGLQQVLELTRQRAAEEAAKYRQDSDKGRHDLSQELAQVRAALETARQAREEQAHAAAQQNEQAQEAREAAQRALQLERASAQERERDLQHQLAAATAAQRSAMEDAATEHSARRAELENRLAAADRLADELREERDKARDAEKALRTGTQALQEKLRLALDANAKLQDVQRATASETSSQQQAHTQEVQELCARISEQDEEITRAARDATNAREELARERTAFQAARDDLDKAFEANRQMRATHEAMRLDLAAKEEALQDAEERIGELSRSLAAAQRSNQQAFTDEITSSQAVVQELRQKLRAVADKLEKKQQQLAEEVKLRKETEHDVEQLRKEHAAQLRQQREHFEQALDEQRAIEQRLRDIATKDDEDDRAALAEMSREITELRRRLTSRAALDDQPSVHSLVHQEEMQRDMELRAREPELVLALQDRVEALEESNKLLSRAFRESAEQASSSDQARTIHQLTMEIEASKRAFHAMRQRLLQAGHLSRPDHRVVNNNLRASRTGAFSMLDQSLLSDQTWAAETAMASGPSDATTEQPASLTRDELSTSINSRRHHHLHHHHTRRHRHGDASQSRLHASSISKTSSQPAYTTRPGPRAPKTVNRALRHEVDMLQDALDKEREARHAAETKAGFLQSEFTDLFVQYFNAEKKQSKKQKKPTAARKLVYRERLKPKSSSLSTVGPRRQRSQENASKLK